MTAPKRLSPEELSEAFLTVVGDASFASDGYNAEQALKSHIAVLEAELAETRKQIRSPEKAIDVVIAHVRAQEREVCARVAEAEPEVPGPMPDALRIHDAEEIARACVRVTKRNIAAAIRAREVRSPMSDGGTQAHAFEGTILLSAPKYSGWQCYLFGARPGEYHGLVYRPLKGREPNAFVRFMMRVFLDCLWVKDDPRSPADDV